MTPKEQRYLLYAIYFTVQGVFLLTMLIISFSKSVSRGLFNNKDGDIQSGEWLVVVLFILKFINSWAVLRYWGNFIDPEGA